MIKSKDVYLPIGPLNYTVIKIFNFADHELDLHSNSKRDLIFSSLYLYFTENIDMTLFYENIDMNRH